MEPQSDCLDTLMDHFSDVRPISLAAVFRRRSRHDHHSTAERAFPLQLRLCGAQERLQSVCRGPATTFSQSVNQSILFYRAPKC